MNWQEIQYNRRGFIHHPDTPEEDKFFYCQQKEEACHYLLIAESFIKGEGVLSYRSIPHGKEELGSKSRYLHRGVYCPSPVLDILITNAKRGKVLVRPNARSNITNRYVYDVSGRLLYVDNYIDGKMVSSEYILYQEDNIYGITIGTSGSLICISKEQYTDKRLENYLCAYYSREDGHLCCHQLDYERYDYDEYGLRDWDYYQIYFGWEKVAPSGFVKHNRYRFTRKEGYLSTFTQINIDGSPIPESYANEIKLKRKA
ncbi:MAG: hypothetical protein IJA75_10005 [Oscillospiraceae bacterium]|nr:hypothetical protein [Oscillospiraceae bacterium]